MPPDDALTLMAVGGGFIILGIVGIIWGRREEKSYFNALSERRDLREFMGHTPLQVIIGGLLGILVAWSWLTLDGA